MWIRQKVVKKSSAWWKYGKRGARIKFAHLYARLESRLSAI